MNLESEIHIPPQAIQAVSIANQLIDNMLGAYLFGSAVNGEWLREKFENNYVPDHKTDPDLAIVLTKVRQKYIHAQTSSLLYLSRYSTGVIPVNFLKTFRNAFESWYPESYLISLTVS